MAIANTYSNIIIEGIIKQMLSEGIPLTVTEIESRFNNLTKDLDLSMPQSDVASMKVKPFENASASKWNVTNQKMFDDIKVAYQEMQDLTNKALKASYRWRLDSTLIESKLNELSFRVDNLIKTQNRGTMHYISENFTDALKTDLYNSTAFIDLNNHTVCLSKNNKTTTRINLNRLYETDVQFSVLSRIYLTGLQQAPGSNLLYAFDDTNRFWQTRVITSSQSKPIITELKVKLGYDPVSISKIEFKSHSSNTSNAVQVTPMLSVDGVTYNYLPTEQTTLSIMDKGSWVFSKTEACFAKFILTKNGCDYSQNNNYTYEFGAEEITFSCESFNTNATQTFYSNVLFAKDLDNNPILFNQVSLEVCERLPDYTDIKYFVSVLPTITSQPTWIPIDPIEKNNSINPNTIQFGNISNLEIAAAGISYDPNGASRLLVNPSVTYNLATIESNSILLTSTTALSPRYALINSNDRLLNCELAANIQVIPDSIELFRNVGSKPPAERILVRGIPAGWTFEEPYYCTVVEVNNQNGYTIDFGDKEIVLDGAKVKGKIIFTPGIHYVKVNKTFWLEVDDITNDKLYPYNHKYLIEGWFNDPIYTGVDRFAGYYMTQVSLVDYLNNVRSDDYTRFAVDIDVSGNKVFMLKCNENLTDFIDETFYIRFDVKNQLYSYLKFKAELKTTSPNITPNLDGYRLRLT